MNLIQSNVKTMNSEELAELLQLRHDNVRQAAINLQSHEVITFTEISVKGNGRPKLVMQFDERNSIIIAAKLNDKLLAAVVDRWKELESAVKEPAVVLPSNYIEALQALIESEKDKAAAKEQLQLAAPKVAFVENLVERENLMTATQVGQKHKMSAVKINKFLDELGGVYNKAVKRGRAFTQAFIDKGYGELKQTEMGYSQALFTAKGEVWINEQLISEGVI
tara:strand:+ start:663 stop:1328 length:666 start_codon:yes stop_codon:yes gene_type:complete